MRSVTFGTTVSHAPASSIFRWKEGMVDLLDQLELLDPLSSTEAQQRVASLVRCALDIAVLWRWRLTSHLLPVYRTRRSSFSTLQRCTFGACRRAWPPAAAAHTCERARTHPRPICCGRQISASVPKARGELRPDGPPAEADGYPEGALALVLPSRAHCSR